MNHEPSFARDERVVELLERLVASIDGLGAELRAAAVASASPLLTCKQFASLLQVDERTLRRLELLGEIPPSMLVGGSKRWRRCDIDRWLAEERAA